MSYLILLKVLYIILLRLKWRWLLYIHVHIHINIQTNILVLYLIFIYLYFWLLIFIFRRFLCLFYFFRSRRTIFGINARWSINGLWNRWHISLLDFFLLFNFFTLQFHLWFNLQCNILYLFINALTQIAITCHKLLELRTRWRHQLFTAFSCNSRCINRYFVFKLLRVVFLGWLVFLFIFHV